MNVSNELDKVINAIANDCLILSKLILDNDEVSINNKVNINTLRNSKLQNDIRTEIDKQDNNIVISTLFNNYINYIEWTRPPNYGKQPPLDVLREWALSKGIPTDNSTLFLIARAIQRDGHEGRPIISVLEKHIVEDFDKEYYSRIFEAMIIDLTSFFNKY